MTERELFWVWVNEENPLLVKEAEEGSQFHKDILDYMFMGWIASSQREGFRFVPVDTLDECLSWASVARWDSPSEERDIEIDYHVGIIEAAIGAVDE